MNIITFENNHFLNLKQSNVIFEGERLSNVKNNLRNRSEKLILVLPRTKDSNKSETIHTLFSIRGGSQSDQPKLIQAVPVTTQVPTTQEEADKLVENELQIFIKNEGLRPISGTEASYVTDSGECYELSATNKAEGLYRAVSYPELTSCLSKTLNLPIDSPAISVMAESLKKNIDYFLKDLVPLEKIAPKNLFIEKVGRKQAFIASKILLNQENGALWSSFQLQLLFQSLTKQGQVLAQQNKALEVQGKSLEKCNTDLRLHQEVGIECKINQEECSKNLGIANSQLTSANQEAIEKRQELQKKDDELRQMQVWKASFIWSTGGIIVLIFVVSVSFYITRFVMRFFGVPETKLPYIFPPSGGDDSSGGSFPKAFFPRTAMRGARTAAGASSVVLSCIASSTVTGVVCFLQGLSTVQNKQIEEAQSNARALSTNVSSQGKETVFSLMFKLIGSFFGKVGRTLED